MIIVNISNDALPMTIFDFLVFFDEKDFGSAVYRRFKKYIL